MIRIKLSDFEPLPDDSIQFSTDFISHYNALVLKDEPKKICIGIITDDVLIKNQLASYYPKAVEFYLISKEDIGEFVSKKLGKKINTTYSEKATENGKNALPLDGPIVNLVNGIFYEGIRVGASDIHIESFEDYVAVRYRIDGVLKIAQNIPVNQFEAISSRIKILSDLNIIERRLPQDGKLLISWNETKYEFRVSILPTQDGESIVLRYFDKTNQKHSLESLGFDEDFCLRLRTASKRKNGLVLLTGATGSGKSTTLNTILKELDLNQLKVITVEDPIESVIKGVVQIQTNEILGLTFDNILKRILRHDPDVIMVGEIRDALTASLAVRAAMTGHLVFSTLHTNDSFSAFERLQHLGIEPANLLGVLRGVGTQRLLRKVCPNCKQVRTVPIVSSLKPKEMIDGTISESFGVGCQNCFSTGYKGRVGIGEFFSFDFFHDKTVPLDYSPALIIEKIRNANLERMIEDGYRKIFQGETTLEELERNLL